MVKKAEKIRVAVLYGGRSGEHEVSLMSAANVLQYLDRSRFEVVPVAISKEGAWYLMQDMKHLSTDAAHLKEMLFKPDALSKMQPLQTATLKSSSHPISFDVVFPVIHGVLCEDGTVQGLLELADVPYVGCGVLASAVGMDKDISKRLAAEAGIAVAPHVVFNRGQWQKNPQKFCDRVNAQLTYPVFVKPVNTGSSVGVHKVKTAQQLQSAIEDAFRYDTRVIIEQAIDAIELEVSVLENNDYGSDPIVSVVGEVRPHPDHEFYTYEAKYLDAEGAELLIPATVSAEAQKKAQQVAKTIFELLECEGMARIDLFLERNTGKIYFNELNTIPGFTKVSMYPKMMEASGIPYSELLTRLIMLAIERHQRRSALLREFVAETTTVVS